MLAAAWLLWWGGALASQPTAFELGVRAFRDGDFDTALEQFQRARATGEDSDQLLFNLGLTLYRLGKYPASREVFEELRGRPRMTELAEYHLGLLAAATDDAATARTHLEVVARSDVPELRQLAKTALSRLEPSRPPPAWAAYARLGPGFDSNRNQIADTLQIEGPEPESAYYDFYGVLNARLRRIGDSTLQGSLFLRNYEVDDTLDQFAMQLQWRKSWRVQRWWLAASTDVESTVLDAHRLYDAYSVSLEASRRLGKATLRLRYRPSVIAAGDRYDYLDGQRHRLELNDEMTLGACRLQVGYEVEFNDRRDLHSGSEFYSQSPTRHGPVLRLSRKLAPALQMDLSAAYRHSRYRDENQQIVDGSLQSQRRVDSLILAGLVLRLEFSPSWGLRLDLRHSDSRSTLPRYEYDRHLAAVAIEWSH